MGGEQMILGEGKNASFDIELFEYCDIMIYREM